MNEKTNVKQADGSFSREIKTNLLMLSSWGIKRLTSLSLSLPGRAKELYHIQYANISLE